MQFHHNYSRGRSRFSFIFLMILTFSFIVFVLLLLLSSTQSVRNNTPTNSWVLVWEDDFEPQKDKTYNLGDKWTFENSCKWGGNPERPELQCYTSEDNGNARVEGGILIITARREKYTDGEGREKEFTSARINSKGSWKYGKFEVRARLPKGRLLWPAIWMMPLTSSYGDWPRSGEIDIMEYRGHDPHTIIGTIHYGPSETNKSMAGTGFTTYPSLLFSDDFHTFGFIWNEKRVQWLLDGEVIHTESLKRNLFPGFYKQRGEPFDEPFYFILNLAVGGDFFPGDLGKPLGENETWDKATFEIDWVKVWEWKPFWC